MLYKRLILLVGMFALACLLLNACRSEAPPDSPIATPTEIPSKVATEEPETPEPTPEATKTPEPKTLVVCMGQEPKTLYPYGRVTLPAYHILQAIYDGVGGGYDNRSYAYQPIVFEKIPSLDDEDALIEAVTVQAGDMVVNNDGDLAELIEGEIIRPAGCRTSGCAIEFEGSPIEMDQMVVTFKIREGVQWSDGEPLTADDSVYGFELNADPETPWGRFAVERTAAYEAIDIQTTVWTGRPGFIDREYFINFWHPFPRHLWQEILGYSAADLLEAEESSRLPMGWGPFVMKEWVPGEHITVEKNPRYWRADEGLPYIDTVIYRFVSDPNTAIAQLIAGECDIVTQDTGLGSLTELLLKLERQNIAKPLFVTGTVWEHLDFGINPAEGYNRPDFFEDVRMRRAIAHCLDRQAVVDTVLYGRSNVLHSYIPPEHPLYADDALTLYEYDVKRGQALLEEMGWVDEDGDGVREAQGIEGIPNGTLLAFNWQSLTTSMHLAYMQQFQQNLAECGINLNVSNLPTEKFFAEEAEGLAFGRRFDLVSFAWLTGVEPPCDLYLSELIPGEGNDWVGQNVSGFINQEYNAVCRRALSSLPGTGESEAAHREAQQIFSEQLPALPLFLHLKVSAYRPEIKGLIMDPTESSEMWNIEAFDIQP